jgi:hypothetical protein
MAYRRGETGEAALMGAMLEAEAFRCQRLIGAFVEGLSRTRTAGPSRARKRGQGG